MPVALIQEWEARGVRACDKAFYLDQAAAASGRYWAVAVEATHPAARWCSDLMERDCMTGSPELDWSRTAEINDVSSGGPHVVLLGAGASKAALPHGDRNGVSVPLLREVASALELASLFPAQLRDLADTDFEAAYSRVFDQRDPSIAEIDRRIREHFSRLALPDEANLYDLLVLCLRPKDSIFTFNWDPFLVQAVNRVARLGVRELPQLYFLHGNVRIGYCSEHMQMRPVGHPCTRCGNAVEPSPLLYPVEHKNYKDGGFLEGQWSAVANDLKHTLYFTVFGYSAPRTDVEAIDLLTGAWGSAAERQMEQVEIISRPGADEGALRSTWAPFIHTHHYEVHGSFVDSWMFNHPRRTIEAYQAQFMDGLLVEGNQPPGTETSLERLVEWFRPLVEVERRAAT